MGVLMVWLEGIGVGVAVFLDASSEQLKPAERDDRVMMVVLRVKLDVV